MLYGKNDELQQVDIKQGANVLSSFLYSFYNDGRIQNIKDQTGKTLASYQYDNNGQLQSYTDTTGNASYTYDNVGNRTTKTAPNGTTSYTYNNLNQLTSRTGADGDAAYQYNNKGELTSKGAETYQWDTNGNIIKITKSDKNTITFNYDAQGRRTEKIVKDAAGTTIHDYTYQYEDATNNLLAQTDTVANSTITYSYDTSGGLTSQTQGGKTYYYNYDGQGNVVSLTDSTGNVVDSYSYDPWGQTVQKTGTLYNPFTYRGYYQDEESGFYYLVNRYYDPQDGRFLSKDPSGTADESLYTYVNNDPVNAIDPDGNAPKIPWGKVFEAGKRYIDKGIQLAQDLYNKAAAGVNKLLGKGTGKITKSGLNFTKTTAKHMENAGRFVPVQTLKQVIKGKGYLDPRGSNAKMYYTTMYRNGKKYNLEVLYDKKTNTIMHFEYARKAMGPLKAIPK